MVFFNYRLQIRPGFSLAAFLYRYSVSSLMNLFIWSCLGQITGNPLWALLMFFFSSVVSGSMLFFQMRFKLLPGKSKNLVKPPALTEPVRVGRRPKVGDLVYMTVSTGQPQTGIAKVGDTGIVTSVIPDNYGNAAVNVTILNKNVSVFTTKDHYRLIEKARPGRETLEESIDYIIKNEAQN